MVVAEVKSQFPASVVAAKNVRQVALNAVLPSIAFERIEELPAAFGAEPNAAGEFAQHGSLQDSLGDGLQGAVMIDIDFHVLFVAGLQPDIHEHIGLGL